MLKHLPNILSWVRIAFTPFIIIFLYDNPLVDNRILSVLLAITLYTLGGLSDYYDGYFARKYNLSSSFGIFLDPLADKIFTLAVFISFAFHPALFLPFWILIPIIVREVGITAVRMWAITSKREMKTEKHGKIKTVLQIVSQSVILAILLHHAIVSNTGAYITSFGSVLDIESLTQFYETSSYPEVLGKTLHYVPITFVLLSLYVTVHSGIKYLQTNFAKSN